MNTVRKSEIIDQSIAVAGFVMLVLGAIAGYAVLIVFTVKIVQSIL